MLDKVISVVKKIWDWIDNRPINFVIFGLACFLVPYFWKWLLIYLIMPGSFALTYAIYRYFKAKK